MLFQLVHQDNTKKAYKPNDVLKNQVKIFIRAGS